MLEQQKQTVFGATISVLLIVFIGVLIYSGTNLHILPLLIILIPIVFIITFINTDVALMLLIFSMLLSPELSIGNVPGRAVVVRVDDILLIIIFFSWLAKMAINKELGFLKNTPLNRPVTTYILVYAISTGLGIIGGKLSFLKSTFYLLKYVEYFMLYFMVTNVIRNKRQLNAFIVIFLITCMLVCIYADLTLGKYGRASAPFEGAGEANTLGGYLVLLLAITAGLILYNRLPNRGLFLWMLAFLIFVTLLNTLSRGSFLAVIPMYLTLLLLSERKKVILTIILLIAVIALPVMLPRKVINRVKSTFVPGYVYGSYGSPVPLDDSAAARLEGLNRVIKMWKKQPFFGYGATGVGFTDMQYALVIGETGIIGFFVFIWMQYIIFSRGLRIFLAVKDNLAKGIVLGFLAGFIGLITHSFSANTFIIIRIMEPFWFLTAAVMVLPEIQTEET